MKENKQKNIKIMAFIALIVSVLSLAIAYTAMSKTAKINKNSNIMDARWNVHFDNLESKTYGDAQIIKYPALKNDKTYIGDFSISLTKPGDSVLFTYDVVNSGSLRAKYQKTLVNNIEKKNKITLEIAKTIFEEADFDGDGKTDDNEIEKALNSIIIEDKIFKGTLQPNEVHSCYLKISFDGNELPKGNVKLNLNIKYIFVQK
mgnify:FL=1